MGEGMWVGVGGRGDAWLARPPEANEIDAAYKQQINYVLAFLTRKQRIQLGNMNI